jgi:hypothetical protein
MAVCNNICEPYDNVYVGDSQHVSTLSLLHSDIRQNLADCIYCYAAQAGLPTQPMLK